MNIFILGATNTEHSERAMPQHIFVKKKCAFYINTWVHNQKQNQTFKLRGSNVNKDQIYKIYDEYDD